MVCQQRDDQLVFANSMFPALLITGGYNGEWGDALQSAEVREIMIGEGNIVVSVILFTFTLKLGPHAHS